jgi:hypothetical protein
MRVTPRIAMGAGRHCDVYAAPDRLLLRLAEPSVDPISHE